MGPANSLKIKTKKCIVKTTREYQTVSIPCLASVAGLFIEI